MRTNLLLVFCLFSIVSAAQPPLTYEGHQYFDLTVNPNFGSFMHLYMEPDGTYRSRVREASNLPFERDVSLGPEPEMTMFDTLPNGWGATQHLLFRTHDPEDLTGQTLLKVQARNLPDNQNVMAAGYFGAFFNGNHALLQINMGTGSRALVNDTMELISHTDPWLNHVLMSMNETDGVLHRRDILYKTGNFSPSWSNFQKYDLPGYRLSDSHFISDYRFRDTIYVVEYGDTTLYHSTDWSTVLTATSTDGPLHHAMVPSGDNQLIVIFSFLHEEQIFRVIRTSGSVNISAGDAPFVHTSEPGTDESLLVAYSPDGNVLWQQQLARFESYDESAIFSFHHSGHVVDGKVVLTTIGSLPSLEGQATGLFQCFANEEIVETALVQDGNYAMINNHIPSFFHTIDLETGLCNSVHRLRAIPIEEGYTTPLSMIGFTSLLPNNIIGINMQLIAASIPVHSIFDQMYPVHLPIINVEAEGLGSPVRIVLFDPEEGATAQMHQVNFTANLPNSTMRFGTAQTAEGRYVLTGEMTRAFTLHFENEDVTFSGSSFGRALAIFTSDGLLSSSEERLQGSPLRVYPNPTMDDLRILGMDGSFVYQIFDLQGRKVRGGEMRGSQAVTLHALQRGSYLIRIVSREGEAQVLRFVKL